MSENLKALRDLLQAREDAWSKRVAISRESEEVASRRLTQEERDELLNDIEKRSNAASKAWGDANRDIEDCVGVISGPDLLAELKALNL